MPRVLILCTGNSCRSQMAEAFLKSFDPTLDVRSAGTRPAQFIHPLTVDVMREAGIDLGGASPKNVDQFISTDFDYLITVCDKAKEDCPVFSGRVRNRIHLGFPDPADTRGTPEEVLAEFRRVRDLIRLSFFKFYRNNILGGEAVKSG